MEKLSKTTPCQNEIWIFKKSLKAFLKLYERYLDLFQGETKFFNCGALPESDEVLMTSTPLLAEYVQVVSMILDTDSGRPEVAKNGIICRKWTTQYNDQKLLGNF